MNRLAAPLAIARVSVRRLLRDRSNIFFVFVFPLALILLIGAQFGGGGGDARTLAVSDGEIGRLGEDLVADLDRLDAIDVVRVTTPGEVVDAVADQQVDAGLVVPAGYGDAAATSSRGVVLQFVARADGLGPALRALVVPVVGAQSQRVSLADLVTVVRDVPFDDALAQADAALAVLPDVGVAGEEVGGGGDDEVFDGLGQFDLGAVQQLLLFVFLASLTNAAALLQSRELGVTRRLLAQPTTTRGIVLGEALGRYGVALVQGLYIVVGTLLLFGVDWGDPVGALVILLAYAAAASGAGLLLGAVASTQSQAAAAGVGIGLGVSALGGSMLPLELFPSALRPISRLTPHAWAYEAYAEVVRRDGGVLDVLPQLGVLVLMAVALFAVASIVLRRRLTLA